MVVRNYVGLTTLIGAGALALAVLLMAASTPASLGPIGVTVWFLLVLIGLAAISMVVAFIITRYAQPKLPARQRFIDAARRGLFFGGYITILLALNSLRQLSLRDALLMLLLIGLVEFYTVARS